MDVPLILARVVFWDYRREMDSNSWISLTLGNYILHSCYELFSSSLLVLKVCIGTTLWDWEFDLTLLFIFSADAKGFISKIFFFVLETLAFTLELWFLRIGLVRSSKTLSEWSTTLPLEGKSRKLLLFALLELYQWAFEKSFILTLSFTGLFGEDSIGDNEFGIYILSILPDYPTSGIPDHGILLWKGKLSYYFYSLPYLLPINKG